VLNVPNGAVLVLENQIIVPLVHITELRFQIVNVQVELTILETLTVLLAVVNVVNVVKDLMIVPSVKVVESTLQSAFAQPTNISTMKPITVNLVLTNVKNVQLTKLVLNVHPKPDPIPQFVTVKTPTMMSVNLNVLNVKTNVTSVKINQPTVLFVLKTESTHQSVTSHHQLFLQLKLKMSQLDLPN